jgi:hypothetical protein
MSRIKDLRTNEDYNLNIVSILEMFSPESKSKYTETLLRMMKNTPNLKEHTKEIKLFLVDKFPFIEKSKLDLMSDIQMMLLYKFIDGFFNTEDLQKYRKFCEYNERNLIEENDLTKYKSFEQMIAAMGVAEMKSEEKELETQVIKIHEDAEWLLIRPLTFKSSCKYGANTKWCTTTEHNQEYYNKYAKRGVLVYCINKKTGYKVAAFYSLDKNEPEFSYWNQKDTRIDSTDSNLPLELIGFIRDYVKDPKVKSNTAMLSGDQKKKELVNGRKAAISERVASAVRRAQEEIEVPGPMEESVMEQPELPFYDERSDETEVEEEVTSYRIPEQPESTIDRMQWSSTSTERINPFLRSSSETE